MTNFSEKGANYLEKRFKEIFTTKEDLTALKSDLINKTDSILKETVSYRKEQTVSAYRLSDHEERITNLEVKHP